MLWASDSQKSRVVSYPGNATKMQHVATDADKTSGTQDEVLTHWRTRAMTLLSGRLLQVSEKPVVTRFWLFELSVKNLLMWNMLELPFGDIVKVQQSQPRASNAKRIKKVQNFMRTDGLAKNLRLSALGLRLCMIATNLTGQKHTRQSSSKASTESSGRKREPMLLRLAGGAPWAMPKYHRSQNYYKQYFQQCFRDK